MSFHRMISERISEFQAIVDIKGKRYLEKREQGNKK